jgi:RNA polymerase sigma-70 factor (ECF subfamily)
MTGPTDARESDEALVARMNGGDEEALRTLHQRYAALVYTVAARFVDAAAAEEVVQDVFVALWRKGETFDPARGAFKSWLVQIVRRRSINEIRRAKSRGGDRADGDDALAQLPDDAMQPDEAQWLAHRRQVLRAAVDALPAPQRQAVSLAFFDELTHEQIASVMGTPVGTTKTRIRLALKRLAPVLLAAFAAAAILAFVWTREQRTARTEQALRMVTASDVVPLHLVAGAGVPAEAHGSYRTRPGSGVAVLTTSHLPAIGAGAPEAYVAWVRGPRGWRVLGNVVVESDGRSLLVSEIDSAEVTPDELRVTREAGAPGASPGEHVVLEWTRP